MNDAPRAAVNATLQFASLIQAWSADEPEVTEASRLLLIDGLAVAVAGANEPGPASMASMLRSLEAKPTSTVIGHGYATAPGFAARINGMSMHVLDYEPMWSPANHAVSTTLPALVALAEQLEAERDVPHGKRLLRALAKGVEVQGRLRLASGQLAVSALSLHPPGMVGPIAAAMACGDLLDLPGERLAAAVGVASSRVGGLLGNVGSMTKALHCGDAAMNGLEAALLAAAGFTSGVDVLTGPRGYAAAYHPNSFDVSHLLASIGTPRILDPGPAWKLFPSQYGTHFVITAALECRAAIDGSSPIAAVRVIAPSLPYLDRPMPHSGLEGKHSVTYCAAAALLDGKVDVATFSDSRRFAADMDELLQRTEYRQDASIEPTFDAMHVTVEVTLADGRVITRRCDAPDGSWTRPVPRERILDKARGLFDEKLGSRAADGILAAAGTAGADFSVSGLMSALGPASKLSTSALV